VTGFDVDALLASAKVVVCCGSGGVGKTTTAAALAVRAAERGRRTVVLTIDPARRLAQAMGLTELDNTPRAVAGVDGALDAMMLDMKRTFDEIVEQHSDPERAKQILANPFYVSLSSSFAGTQEYMAMEKLGQLVAERRWDLVVVDTPPTRSALDFLDAPKRLGSFLDGRLIKVLLAPAKAGGRAYLKVINTALAAATRVVSRVIGAQMLTDLQQFVASLETMFGGFRSRADQTYAMLKAPGTAFVVVASPEPAAVREASYFADRLTEERMPLAGLVVNRVHVSPGGGLGMARSISGAETLEAAGGHDVAAALLRLHAERTRIAEREDALIGRFRRSHPQVPVRLVPALETDVHDLAGLRLVGGSLAEGQPAIS
jgi:anion-transporting  ArsA/GET3 family ATPase